MYLVCLLNTQGAWTFRKSTLAPLNYRVSLLDKDLKAKRLKTLIFTKNLSPLKNRVMNFQIYQVCEPIFCRCYQPKSLKVSLLVLSENLEMFKSMDKNEGDRRRWQMVSDSSRSPEWCKRPNHSCTLDYDKSKFPVLN